MSAGVNDDGEGIPVGGAPFGQQRGGHDHLERELSGADYLVN